MSRTLPIISLIPFITKSPKALLSVEWVCSVTIYSITAERIIHQSWKVGHCGLSVLKKGTIINNKRVYLLFFWISTWNIWWKNLLNNLLSIEGEKDQNSRFSCIKIMTSFFFLLWNQNALTVFRIANYVYIFYIFFVFCVYSFFSTMTSHQTKKKEPE